MNDSLYSVTIRFDSYVQASEWIQFKSKEHPQTGLMDYGLGITNNGLLLLYGGVTNNNQMNRRLLNYTIHAQLWTWDLTSSSSQFVMGSFRNGLGFSRIAILSDDCFYVINNRYKSRRIFSTRYNEEYEIKAIDSPTTFRIAFGLATISENSFLMIGGYKVHEDTIQELEPSEYLTVVSFGFENQPTPQYSEVKIGTIVGVVIIATTIILSAIFVIVKWNRGSKLIPSTMS
jgi:hypothetical protein